MNTVFIVGAEVMGSNFLYFNWTQLVPLAEDVSLRHPRA
jgi:hypothetical protein